MPPSRNRPGLPPLWRAAPGVFGSAARTAGFDPETSDADFLVAFDPEMSLPPMTQFFGLAFEPGELLGRPVDLIEAGAVRNPYLRSSIDHARELIYAA